MCRGIPGDTPALTPDWFLTPCCVIYLTLYQLYHTVSLLIQSRTVAG
jgi:hypothetical protein